MSILQKIGVMVGHYTDAENITGATCFVFDSGAEIGIDIRGSNTGSINIPSYSPKAAARKVKAVVLTGGSTHGLECTLGVMKQLDTHGVVGGVIYDIEVGNHVAPGLDAGRFMAANASFSPPEQGSVGVGTGATCGKWERGRKLKGGFGWAAKEVLDEAYIAAFVVTNSVGDVIHPLKDGFYADIGGYSDMAYKGVSQSESHNTTLAVIATNITMEREELMKVSELCHDGMARAIHPIHTMSDGDIIFSLSTGGPSDKSHGIAGRNRLIDLVGLHASDILIDAIKSSIVSATGIEGYPAYKDIF